MKPRLVEPTPELTEAFLEMAREWQIHGQDRFSSAFGDFPAYVETLLAMRIDEGLPEDRVPGSTFWLVLNDQLIGTSRLRHRLVPHLEKEGGHIGYDIRPSQRRKGFGTEILACTLQKARELGLSDVLVTCDSDNVASVRIIEHNDGEFLGYSQSDNTGKQVSRYRIALG